MQLKYDTIGMEKLKEDIELIRIEAEDLRKNIVNIYEPISRQIAPRSISIIYSLIYEEMDYHSELFMNKINIYKNMIHDLKETVIEVDENIAKEEGGK